MGLLAVLAVVLAGCAVPSRSTQPGFPDVEAPRPRFDTREVRQPAIFIRVEVHPGALSDRQAASLPSDYEGALLESLNTRAIMLRDVTIVPTRERLDIRAALARAREVGADHALLVDVAIAQLEGAFCRGTRGAFRAATLTVAQRVTVVRASDGVVRWQPHAPIEVAGVEPDCDDPRASRVRSTSETVQAAVDRLLQDLLAAESAR